MNKLINKIQNGWRSFLADFKQTAYFLENAVGVAVLSAGAATALHLATILALPPPVPQLLFMGAVASAFSAVVCSGLTINTFLIEKRDRTATDSFIDDNGRTMEGPRWAVRRLVTAQSEQKDAFNKIATLKTDPLIAAALESVTVKTVNTKKGNRP